MEHPLPTTTQKANQQKNRITDTPKTLYPYQAEWANKRDFYYRKPVMIPAISYFFANKGTT